MNKKVLEKNATTKSNLNRAVTLKHDNYDNQQNENLQSSKYQ